MYYLLWTDFVLWGDRRSEVDLVTPGDKSGQAERKFSSPFSPASHSRLLHCGGMPASAVWPHSVPSIHAGFIHSTISSEASAGKEWTCGKQRCLLGKTVGQTSHTRICLKRWQSPASLPGIGLRGRQWSASTPG